MHILYIIKKKKNLNFFAPTPLQIKGKDEIIDIRLICGKHIYDTDVNHYDKEDN